MKVNLETKRLLVENPLTGNKSLSSALKMVDVLTVPQWATPDACRRALLEWKDFERIILVRNPVSRFDSGATLAFSSAKHSGPLLSLVESTPAATSPQARALAILRHIADGGEVPVFLQPQSQWLTAHFNLIIATHTIAEWSNFHNLYTIRTGQNSYAAGAVNAFLSHDPEARSIFDEYYAKDIAMLAKLPVWSPDPTKVRFVSGYCATCSASNPQETIDPASLESSAQPEPTEQEPSPEEAPVGEVAPSKPRRSKK